MCKFGNVKMPVDRKLQTKDNILQTNYSMKRLLVISLIALGACKGNNTSKPADGQMPTALVNNPHTADGIDTVAAARKPTMDFTDTLHNFGTIHEKEIVEYEFSFKNNGKTPLVINSAVGSCGCTVPSYPHDPVEPGKTGVMKVTFNSAGKSGHQEKTVTIHTNTIHGLHMLFIKADIAKE